MSTRGASTRPEQMQARFSTPSSLAAHHRRLIASCAETGCPQVRHRSGAKLSAPTVGEPLCMSKSVEAHYKGQIVSARDLPTGCQQQCSLLVPTVRAPRHLTEPSAKPPQKQPTKRPEREGRRGQPAPRSAFPRDAATADQRLMTRPRPCHSSRWRQRLAWPGTSGSSIRVSRMGRGQCDRVDRDIGGPIWPAAIYLAQEETCTILSPSQMLAARVGDRAIVVRQALRIADLIWDVDAQSWSASTACWVACCRTKYVSPCASN